KMSEDDWDTVLGVHLKGSFLMTRATQKHMVDQRYGRIVNLSSSSALGNRGITANAVAPGFIATDMTAATAARIGMDFEEFKKAAATQIPVRRVGQPDDVANVASFLA